MPPMPEVALQMTALQPIPVIVGGLVVRDAAQLRGSSP